MLQIINEIFQILKIPKFLGYILLMCFSLLIFIGGLYVTEKVKDKFQSDHTTEVRNYNDSIRVMHLIDQKNYIERKDNQKEILRILKIIGSDIGIYLDVPFETPFTPKPNFDEIIEKLNKVIEDNTYNFSIQLRSDLVHIRYLLYDVRMFDKMLVNGNYDDDVVERAKAIDRKREKFEEDFLRYYSSINAELNKIEQDLKFK